jgi:hypothetical protein
VPGGQTHGLVAHRSVGDEDGGIDPILAAARQQFGAVLFEGAAVAAVCRHAVEAPRNLADRACRGAAPQLRQREPGIAVFGSGVRAVDGEMGDPQIVIVRAVSE